MRTHLALRVTPLQSNFPLDRKARIGYGGVARLHAACQHILGFSIRASLSDKSEAFRHKSTSNAIILQSTDLVEVFLFFFDRTSMALFI